MAGKLKGVLKEIAKRRSSELGTKGRLLFKAPLGPILLGIDLDCAPSGNCYVNSVIIPLHSPTNWIYYQGGPGSFNRQTRLRTVTGNKLWQTREDYLIGLEDVVLNDLLPEWTRLSNPNNCIDFFTSLPGYGHNWGGRFHDSLIYLTAYQQSYERCLQYIEEFKELFPNPDPMQLSEDSYPAANWQRMKVIQDCIRSENFALLEQKLNKWYQYSVEALGLTKFV
jgi:hypothetical protein